MDVADWECYKYLDLWMETVIQTVLHPQIYISICNNSLSGCDTNCNKYRWVYHILYLPYIRGLRGSLAP